MNANSHSHNNSLQKSQGMHPAKQDRSRKNRDKIVNAFAELLKENSFERVTVAQIAKRAHVAVGTVYRRFKNKDALIPVVFELYQTRLVEWTSGKGRMEVDENASLHDVLKLIIHGAWQFLLEEAHILRTVHLYARLRPDAIENLDMWQEWEDAAYQSFQPLMQAFPDEIKRENLDTAARMMTYFMNAFFLEKGLYPDESPAAGLNLSDDMFLNEAVDMLYGYLITANR